MSPGTILDGDKRILEARKPTVRLPQEGVEPSRTTAAAQAQVRQPITCSIVRSHGPPKAKIGCFYFRPGGHREELGFLLGGKHEPVTKELIGDGIKRAVKP